MKPMQTLEENCLQMGAYNSETSARACKKGTRFRPPTGKYWRTEKKINDDDAKLANPSLTLGVALAFPKTRFKGCFQNEQMWGDKEGINQRICKVNAPPCSSFQLRQVKETLLSHPPNQFCACLSPLSFLF